MTGTADTEAVEFNKIYKLDVVVIPTNRTLVRDDAQDVIYRTAREKFNCIADDIEIAQKKGQPVLVGTVSVEKSELLSSLLKKKNIPHEILNAKNHAREANIITDAGKLGHVTIATNMAGRGTDIVLGDGVKEAGGLYVIGTERHESRRIDNQLRGRSGRQGDPGKSKFFLSLEDDLMRIFASDKLSAIMGRWGMEEGEAIVSPMVTRAIEKAQRRVEEQNFSSRKNLLEYDDVMSQQRQVIYQRRKDALDGKGDITFVKEIIENILHSICSTNSPELSDSEGWDFQLLKNKVRDEFNCELPALELDTMETASRTIIDEYSQKIFDSYQEKVDLVGEENMQKLASIIYLQIIDQAWKEHLLAMDALKDSVSFRGYAQRDPLQEYKKEAFTLFANMIERVESETTLTLIRMPKPEKADLEQSKNSLNSDDQIDGLTFTHPEAETNTAHEQENLIYNDEPNTMAQQAQAPQTYKRESEKVGRNDPCPCGSGRKYKKCCGAASLVQEST